MEGDFSGSADAPPYFFLSYAHTPRIEGYLGDPDIWVVNLFRDLCSHIMQLTDLPSGVRPGFMDRELRAGSDWPSRLAHALAACRVFVPLYSSRYFASENCGKEWFAFSRRALNHAARSTGSAEAIVPALWVPVAPALLPEAAKSIQFDHSEFGHRYGTHGFYGIIKLSRYHGDYEEAVYELARRIVDVAHSTHIGSEPPAPYDSIESAFGSVDQPKPGERRLRITIVAPEASDLPSGRGDYHYGRVARNWNPYRPESMRSLADHVADLVRNLDYWPDVGDLEEHLNALLGGEHTPAPGVLLVDAWATMQAEYRQKLRKIDALGKPWIRVVVPWNHQDMETLEAGPILKQNLEAALRKKLAVSRVDCRAAADGVPNLEEFGIVLPMIVRAAARQYVRNANAYPPEGPVSERPRLTGPLTSALHSEHYYE
jgi:FxsC-like protein